MKDVSGFLEKLNLEEYLPIFLREGITLDLIAELTEAELRQIGVRKLGERLRFLRLARKLEAFNQAEFEIIKDDVTETTKTEEEEKEVSSGYSALARKIMMRMRKNPLCCYHPSCRGKPMFYKACTKIVSYSKEQNETKLVNEDNTNAIKENKYNILDKYYEFGRAGGRGLQQ